MPIFRKTLAAALALPVLLSGCVYLPTAQTYQDPTCNVERHRLGLQSGAVENFDCGSADPASCLVGLLLVGPTTYVVFGSTVVVGNLVLSAERDGENYWRQKTGKCHGGTIATPSYPPSPGDQPPA